MVSFLDGLEAYLATFSDAERAVSRHAFRALLAGRAMPRTDFAAPLALAPNVAAAAIDRHVERGTMLVEDERVVAARGLSLPRTAHALELDGRRLHAFCAVDAIGIPVALGLDARIQSACHDCRAPLALALARGVLTDAPPGIVIWAVDRDPERSLRGHT